MPRHPIVPAIAILLLAACGSAPPTKGEDAPHGTAGVGIILGMDHEGRPDATPTVAQLALTGAAAQVGVARYDSIWAIDGRDTAGMSKDAVEALLQGPIGSKVKLRVGRIRSGARDAVVTRAPLPANKLQCEDGDCKAGTGSSVDMWGERYEGEFKDGKYHGKGKVTRADGQVYEGHFADGLPDGAGIVTNAGGDRFEGTFAKGAPVGELKIVLANGDFYEGATVGLEMQGQGRLERPDNGDVWEGRYEHNKLIEGTWLHHPANGDGRTCTRNIVNGFVAPTGTITYAKNDAKKRELFEGGFGDACMANGEGIMRYANKKARLKGMFVDDEPQADAKPVE
ncbi:MAG: hypothetical protein U1F43_16285 [Myxococcota bacterium]